MIIGQAQSKIDEKNRIAFPKKFRHELGDKLIITQNMEGSLLMVSQNKWKTLLEGTEGRPFTDSPARETQRFLFGGAEEVELDEKGRFILPKPLRDYAGISQDVLFLGVYNRVEVWDKMRWEEYNKDHLIKNINHITRKLSNEK